MPRKKRPKASKEARCERLTVTGKPCQMFALLKKDHCAKHQWAPRYDGNAKSLNEIPEQSLKTVEEVRGFLEKVMFVVKNGGDPEQRHKGIVEIAKQLIAAIKERDNNSDEKHEKELEVAKATQTLVQNMTMVEVRQLLVDKNLAVLESKMGDEENVKTIQLGSVQRLGREQPEDESGTD